MPTLLKSRKRKTPPAILPTVDPREQVVPGTLEAIAIYQARVDAGLPLFDRAAIDRWDGKTPIIREVLDDRKILRRVRAGRGYRAIAVR